MKESLFQPLGNEVIACVNRDLAESLSARVDELVGNACRHDHDLTAADLDPVVASGEGSGTLQDHKDFLIRMRVELWSNALRHVHGDSRHGDIALFSLKTEAVFAGG